MLTAPTTLFRRAPWALIIRAEPLLDYFDHILALGEFMSIEKLITKNVSKNR